MIRVFDLAARHARRSEAVEAAALAVLRSGAYVGGPAVASFEEALATSVGARCAVGVASGTDALVLALQAMGVGPGDEVVVPAVSFLATATAVALAGAVPVVADVQVDRPLLDATAVASALTDRTRAVVPVHLFGDLATGIREACDVPVLDDAAQAFGAEPSILGGVASCLSFYPTKVLGGAGEGGAVVTDDAELAARVRALANHGGGGLVAGAVPRNARLDALQAAILHAQLAFVHEDRQRRQAIAARYDAAVGPRAVPRSPGSAVSLYVVRHPERDRVRDALATRGIETRIYYDVPLSRHPVVACRRATPAADAFCAEAFAVPCRAELADSEVASIAEALHEVVA